MARIKLGCWGKHAVPINMAASQYGQVLLVDNDNLNRIPQFMFNICFLNPDHYRKFMNTQKDSTWQATKKVWARGESENSVPRNKTKKTLTYKSWILQRSVWEANQLICLEFFQASTTVAQLEQHDRVRKG